MVEKYADCGGVSEMTGFVKILSRVRFFIKYFQTTNGNPNELGWPVSQCLLVHDVYIILLRVEFLSVYIISVRLS